MISVGVEGVEIILKCHETIWAEYGNLAGRIGSFFILFIFYFLVGRGTKMFLGLRKSFDKEIWGRVQSFLVAEKSLHNPALIKTGSPLFQKFWRIVKSLYNFSFFLAVWWSNHVSKY